MNAPTYVDGRNLEWALEGSPMPSDWRKSWLIQNGGCPSTNPKAFFGLVTETGWKYVEYGDGFKELYDLNADPYELQNIAGSQPVLEAALHERLNLLKTCKGSVCRSLESEPLP